MPMEMGIWRIDEGRPQRLSAAMMPSEAELEQHLEQDPTLLGERLLVIGRQIRTPHNTIIDLLAVDGDGHVHVLELKRDKTPREIVAQILDYASWVRTLGHDDVIALAGAYSERTGEAAFEARFAEAFGAPVPDELNVDLHLTIVAAALDDSSERIIGYLRDFGVPLNAVFFTYLADGDRRYLARSWLAASESEAVMPTRRNSKTADWNGRDWYVNFGDDGRPGRSWEDGRHYGFVSAGGGAWYSESLKKLPVGARVFAYVPKHGYVGVGETLAAAAPVDEALVSVNGDWVPLRSLDLRGTYQHGRPGEPVTPETAEYVVPVRWLATEPLDQAYWEPGLFANMNSACRLRQAFTIERVLARFGVDEKTGLS